MENILRNLNWDYLIPTFKQRNIDLNTFQSLLEKSANVGAQQDLR